MTVLVQHYNLNRELDCELVEINGTVYHRPNPWTPRKSVSEEEFVAIASDYMQDEDVEEAVQTHFGVSA